MNDIDVDPLKNPSKKRKNRKSPVKNQGADVGVGANRNKGVVTAVTVESEFTNSCIQNMVHLLVPNHADGGDKCANQQSCQFKHPKQINKPVSIEDKKALLITASKMKASGKKKDILAIINAF